MAIIGSVLLAHAVRNHQQLDCVHHHGVDDLHDHFHDGRTARTRTIGAALAGLVPCTGAILILLFAVANNLLFIGLLMVLAIGLGMTFTMSALAFAAIAARTHALAWAGTQSRTIPLAYALSYAGPIMIITLGAMLFYVSL